METIINNNTNDDDDNDNNSNEHNNDNIRVAVGVNMNCIRLVKINFNISRFISFKKKDVAQTKDVEHREDQRYS